ncbi:MAG: twin-arginine translocase TatA/TatE family subunit [Rhodanobacteraceae bacterium]
MDEFSPFHILILLVIVVLPFGTGKLKKLSPDLGKAVRGFKQALQGGDEHDKAKSAADTAEKLQADAPDAPDAPDTAHADATKPK